MVLYIWSSGTVECAGLCLNPCCSGRWSCTTIKVNLRVQNVRVLILVVVEDGLVLSYHTRLTKVALGLNPCCSGRWSCTRSALTSPSLHLRVLILVVVEDGLVRVSLCT